MWKERILCRKRLEPIRSAFVEPIRCDPGEGELADANT